MGLAGVLGRRVARLTGPNLDNEAIRKAEERIFV